MISYFTFSYRSLFMGISSVVLLLHLLMTMESHAQEIDPQPTSPTYPVSLQRVDARSLSMGEALIGDPFTISVIAHNPSVLSLLDYPRSVSIGSWYDSRLNRLTHSLSMPVFLGKRHRLATLMNLQHRGDRKLSLWEKPAEMDPEFMLYDVSLVYSVLLGDHVSVGVSQTLAIAENELDQRTTGSTHIGIQYHPDPSLSYGLVFRGIGRSPTFQIDEHTETLPEIDTGTQFPKAVQTSHEEEPSTRLGTTSLAQQLEIGGSFRYPVDFSPNRIVMSLASSKEFGRSGLLFKGGLELWATPWLALRGGFLVRTRTNEDGPRFGMGLKGSWVWLDYGVAYSDRRKEYQHQFTLTLPFCVKCTSY